jgi:ribosomal protein L40E
MVPIMPAVSVASLVQALFTMRAFNLLAVKSEVRLFRTAGLALVAGSLLGLILGCIGVLLFLAASISVTGVLVIPFAGTAIGYLAWIVAAQAFFAVKVPTSQALPASAAVQVKYCPQCGAANLQDAVFCVRCGKKL